MQITAPRLLGVGVIATVLWAAHEVSGGGTGMAAPSVPGVPQISLDAYVAAQQAVPPTCGLTASLVAGIGAVESGHGTFGGSQPDNRGTVSPPIRGPRLDGVEFALIFDTDRGELDGDAVYDRAVGPMQFIPGTWQVYAEPGDDPQNIVDAARATARLLCAVAEHEQRPLTDPAVEEAAIRAYNNDGHYVAQVRAFRDDFKVLDGATGGGRVTADEVMAKLGDEGSARWSALGQRINAAPGEGLDRAFGAVDPFAQVVWNTLGSSSSQVAASLSTDASEAGMVTVGGITVSETIAPDVEALLNAAARDGVALTGSGWRSNAEQIELRRQHCGTTDYDVYQRPPGECSPPTAIPGTSNHETGLAIDFRDGDGVSLSWGSPGFEWLTANAGRFGLYNLPSEPWHWSVDGR